MNFKKRTREFFIFWCKSRSCCLFLRTYFHRLRIKIIFFTLFFTLHTNIADHEKHFCSNTLAILLCVLSQNFVSIWSLIEKLESSNCSNNRMSLLMKLVYSNQIHVGRYCHIWWKNFFFPCVGIDSKLQKKFFFHFTYKVLQEIVVTMMAAFYPKTPVSSTTAGPWVKRNILLFDEHKYENCMNKAQE